MRNYILVEHIQGGNYNETEQSLMFCQYIDVDTYHSAKQRCIDEIVYETHGDKPIQNADLHMDALPITVAKYHAQTPSTRQAGVTTGISRQLTQYKDESGSHDDFQYPIIRSLSKRNERQPTTNNFSQKVSAQCKACGTWGHNEKTCSVTAKVLLAQEYLAKHPREAKKLAQEYLRVNSRSLKQGVVRALLALPGLQDDDIDNFVNGLEIPMTEISDSEWESDMIIDAVNPTSFHTDDQPIPSQLHNQPDDDDESVEQDLVDEIMATLQNDECTMHEIQIMHPPDMQHIYHHDVLLQDRLNEDIDLQDAIPKTAHLQNETDAAALTLATVRQIKNKELNIKIHIDGGSNRSVTPSLELLDNITDIPPYHMFGASSDEVALTCNKVGVLRLPCNNHAVLPIRTYYSPQADETIISPGDVTT